MKLISYKNKNGNFGDDLNSYLWPKIFGPKFSENENIAFLGIGSILTENSTFIKEASLFDNKLILGTGVRSLKENLTFDETWDFSFLRGPLSSFKITGSFNNFITDSAYFYALLDEYKKVMKLPKKHKISVIPYFKSIDLINWKKFCDKNNLNLITPSNLSVEEFIIQVASSERVYAEAMHGAIMADILRVPWKRIKFNAHFSETEVVSEFKWHDWFGSINLHNVENISLYKRPIPYNEQNLFKKVKSEKRFFKLGKKLTHNNSFYLSNESRFTEIITQLQEKRSEVLKKYF
ncbi:polysaccharide pyruvyl transferase family protein [Wenyingzhuangia sp. IMCC45574]